MITSAVHVKNNMSNFSQLLHGCFNYAWLIWLYLFKQDLENINAEYKCQLEDGEAKVDYWREQSEQLSTALEQGQAKVINEAKRIA